MNTKTIIALSVSVVLLSACSGSEGNGGNSGSTAQANPINGTAIDGYITGGTAFIDYNYNGKLDAGEPSAVTGEKGAFDITPTGEFATCADYAPVIIDVPVGAIDSDFGPVTEAYQMVHPPVFATPGREDTRITTPLTTLVWNSISRELQTAGIQNCNDVKDKEAMRNDISTRVSQQEWRIANRYSITVDELYSDFIETGNTRVHQLAVDVVPTLQKSFEETKLLSDANPNAFYTAVEYYLGRWDEEAQAYDDKWYREESVYTAAGWTRLTEEYNEDLVTKIGVVYEAKNVEYTNNTNGIKYELLREFETGSSNNRCSVNEYITQAPIVEEQTRENEDGTTYTVTVAVDNTGTIYGIRNLASGVVTNPIDCTNYDYATHVTNRMLLTDDNAGESSEHMYFGTNLVGYDSLIGLGQNYDTLTSSELDAISNIPTDFNDDGYYGADRWARNKSTTDATGNQTLLIKDSDGVYARLITQTNGIQTVECSSDTGNTWIKVDNLSQCSN